MFTRTIKTLALIALSVSASGFISPPKATRAFLATSTAIAMSEETPEVKVGDKIPDVAMMEGQADYGTPQEVKLGELIAGKKVAIFAVPGEYLLSVGSSYAFSAPN